MPYSYIILQHKTTSCITIIFFELYTAPPPAPGSIELSHITNGHMTFIWEPINRSCPAVSYLVNASDCGECPSVTTSANITCYTGSLGREQVCAISVQTVLCGNIIGNHGEISRFILRGSFIIISLSLHKYL